MTPQASLDLQPIPIVDHHAHPLRSRAATQDAAGFRQWFTESTDPVVHAQHVPHSLFFQTAIRWLAEMLMCEPTLDSVLHARAEQPEEAWIRRLFHDANIERVLCDYGFGGTDAYSHADMQRALPCRVEPILRLETLAEALILREDHFDHMVETYVAAVARARRDGYVALKSIIAYRTGLAVEAQSADDAAAAFDILKAAARQTGRVRLAQKPLCDYLLYCALSQIEQQQLPIQIHTGFGDRDADLRWANPLHLRPAIEKFPDVPFVLLHAGWPYYREMAHLAAIYRNVWMDLSLAIPFATTGIPTMLRDVLGMAPFSKILFATDAFTMPEIFWLAARWGRWGLSSVLGEFIEQRLLTRKEAVVAASRILGDNARQLYNLL